MIDFEQADEDHPAYTYLQENLRGQATTMGGLMTGEDADNPDPDPDGKILECIREGRTIGPQSKTEHVSTLAGLGYSIETTADAVDESVEEVEILARARVIELAEMMEHIQQSQDAQDGGPNIE